MSLTIYNKDHIIEFTKYLFFLVVNIATIIITLNYENNYKTLFIHLLSFDCLKRILSEGYMC